MHNTPTPPNPHKHLTISRNIHHDVENARTLGERAADQIAAFGGSWIFIGCFAFILLSWVGLNSWVLANKAVFDPYPYILLNLFLSMLAALQAPIIMMSQNRQAAIDRAAAAHDYEINLKAELEIIHLHEKIDQLLLQQQKLQSALEYLRRSNSNSG